ncbi:MAG TPA: ArsA-related P-loop ATPase [Nocardioidaceae bacterium]|nr:ArsA-related P-loop ATPase [Nocardioidaceae bacterium]
MTGKGGTGKTTVAGALALALASAGHRVLLCEVEGRQGIAQLFDVPPLPYEERSIAVASQGGEVYALAIDPESALLEYLAMYYRLGRADKALDRFGVIDFATTIAPGVRDVLLTGKVYEAARRRTKAGDPVYDAIVLDAPPTGRIARFLNVNSEVAGLAKVGRIRRQADAIMTLMRSQRTAVHLVTLLEEMPVQETQDAIEELTAADLPVGSVIVNLQQRSPLDRAAQTKIADGKLGPSAVVKGLAKVGVETTTATATGLLHEAKDHLARLELQERQRKVVDGLGQPVVELPRMPDGIDLGALYDLAHELQAQGLP